MTTNEFWENVLGLLSTQISEQNFYTWIEPMHFHDKSDDTVTLHVPSRFMKDIVEERYLETLRGAIEKLEKKAYRVNILVEQQVDKIPEKEPAHEPAALETSVAQTTPSPTQQKEKLHSDVRHILSPRYIFDSFVVGSSNQFAHAAAMAVANGPGVTYNPLFIYGGVGLGKTHLMQAVGNAIYQDNRSAKIMYVQSEVFTNEMINALKNGKIEEFRQRYRYVDVLLIDDIQFIAGKDRTQEEFFHTFNTLHGEKKQIVLSSDKFPREIPHLEERLRSRFEWGLIADIQPPDLETKMAILRKKAESIDMYLPNEVALFIAKAIKHNIRELEGCLNRISAYAHLTGVEPTVDIIKNVLKDILKDSDKVVNCEDIQRQVSLRFNLKTNDLKSKNRSSELTHARHIAMYFCRKLTNMSLPQIGREFGGRDHSTVVHAIKTVEAKSSNDDNFKVELESIENQIINQ
ncbi:chromosomal replication initiator protein DnaA [Desulfurispirillum indicum S5]|uniref:Chromosomal replication initiator protein DnaA n=1 Tax=Desulfurispirillum indicum (strain ATCC BAA-1389 / DSM 22839 / S5) TaxID=653733 RepID=E6W482_DESIS|nr:chromosomal replication initiator protein DnaA [Desulfurispirillum indicum]ADU64760.1 chromosomal replication initiator protein DnaA [Desulfurispirillum indicum S5]